MFIELSSSLHKFNTYKVANRCSLLHNMYLDLKHTKWLTSAISLNLVLTFELYLHLFALVKQASLLLYRWDALRCCRVGLFKSLILFLKHTRAVKMSLMLSNIVLPYKICKRSLKLILRVEIKICNDFCVSRDANCC